MKLALLPMLAAFAVAAAAPPVFAEPAVGFQKLSLPATDRYRALEAVVWYPAAETGGETALVGDNRVVVGTAVRIGAPPQSGRHRLVVLSHGYGGNWTNQQWLAADLAARGYLVAALNHPGSTSREMAPPGAAMLWKRPGDVSHVIDWLAGDARWSGLVEAERVAVIGHSLGGWTAVALAGGRFEPARLEAACMLHPRMAACGTDLGGTNGEAAAAAWSLKDERIAAVVTFDLGLSQGFDPASFGGLTMPVLVVGAGPGDPRMPVELESRHLAGLLPGGASHYVEIGDAGHFSFLTVCKADAIPLLEADRPGDGMICRDRDGRSREAIHRQLSDLVTGFLEAAMPQP